MQSLNSERCPPPGEPIPVHLDLRHSPPQIKTIVGVVYCNDGDCVESLSALVEILEGELKIVEWQHRLLPVPAPNMHETEEEAHA